MVSGAHSSTNDGPDQLQTLFLIDHNIGGKGLSELSIIGCYTTRRTWWHSFGVERLGVGFCLGYTAPRHDDGMPTERVLDERLLDKKITECIIKV